MKNQISSDTYCIIMAGGLGNRFWPVSSKKRPKQFSDILNTGKSFIQQSYERVRNIFPKEQIIVVTGEDYADITKEQLPELPSENLLIEPCVRNTATCIAYCCYKLAQQNPNASLVIIPSDHFITNDFGYINNIISGVEFIHSHEGLLTVGVPPTRVETQYGYIQLRSSEVVPQIHKVKTFTEKPSEELANIFFDSTEFLWNAGILITKCSNLIKEFEQHMFNVHALFTSKPLLNTPEETEFVRFIYGECHNISIDVGILERSQNVYVLKGDFGWSDVGTWHAFHELSEQDQEHNSSNQKEVLFKDSSNCIVNIDQPKQVIIQGVDGLIVAEKENILMICNRKDEDKIKRFERQFR